MPIRGTRATAFRSRAAAAREPCRSRASVSCRALAQVPLFAPCSGDIIAMLAQRLQTVVYMPDELVIKEGLVGNSMYFIQQAAAPTPIVRLVLVHVLVHVPVPVPVPQPVPSLVPRCSSEW